MVYREHIRLTTVLSVLTLVPVAVYDVPAPTQVFEL